MYDLDTLHRKNIERTIQLVLDTAEQQGTVLTRDQVLDHLRFNDEEDVTPWEAMVEAALAERATRLAA